jgi:multidrug transporter EmrE-like cation transporter
VVPCLRDVYGLGMADAAFYATAMSLALFVAGPLTGFVSGRVLRRRRLPYTVLTAAQFVAWLVFVLTLGRLPLAGLYALLFAMGLVGAALVLTWPLGREVNPPHLAGIAVATVNLGGFAGAALDAGSAGRAARRPVGRGGGRERARLPGRGLPGELRGVRDPDTVRLRRLAVLPRDPRPERPSGSAPPRARLRRRGRRLAGERQARGRDVLRPFGLDARERQVERPERLDDPETTTSRGNHLWSAGTTCHGARGVLVCRTMSSYAAMYSSQRRRSSTSVSENFQCFSGSSSRARKRCRCCSRETWRKNFRTITPFRPR